MCQRQPNRGSWRSVAGYVWRTTSAFSPSFVHCTIPPIHAGYLVKSQTGYIQVQIQLWWQSGSDARHGGNHKPGKYPEIFWLDDACEDHKQKTYPVLGKGKHIGYRSPANPPDPFPDQRVMCFFLTYLELDISFVCDPRRHHRITKYPIYPDISDHMSHGP